MAIANSIPDPTLAANSVKPGVAGERACRIGTVISGLVLVAVGVCTSIGWLTDHLGWVRIGSDETVMVFNTALSFVATGTALIALAYHRLALMRLLGAILVVVSSVSALQLPFHTDYGIDELFFTSPHMEGPFAATRMSINSAVCFLLLGLAFLVVWAPGRQVWRTVAAACLAAATIAISVVAMFGHASGLSAAFGWGGTRGMATLTAICFTISAASVLVWAARFQTQMGISIWKWFPYIFGSAAIVSSIGLWHALAFQDTQRIQNTVHALFDDIYWDVKDSCRHHEGALTSMAKRWNAGGGTTEANWRHDARNDLDTFKGYDALAWVDSKLRPRWIEVAHESDLAKIVANEGVVRELIKRSRRQQAVLAVGLIEGSTQVAKVWLCAPVISNGNDDGCLLAEIDMRGLMSAILQRTPTEGQFFAIRDRQLVLFDNAHIPGQDRAQLSETAELPFANLRWTFTDTPSRAWLASQRSLLPTVILGAGVLLAILLAASLQLAVWARSNQQLASISEARFRAIFDNAPLGISVIDDQGRFLLANGNLQQILGFSEDQLFGRSFVEVTHPDDLERFRSLHQELIAGNKSSYQVELRSHGSAGQTIWISVCCAAIPEAGNAQLAVGMVTDITERKMAELHLAFQYQIARLLSEDVLIPATMNRVISIVCEMLDWDSGEIWVVDPKDSSVLRPLVICEQSIVETREFALASKKFKFARGEGLPGRVWETKQAAWIENVIEDPNSPRADLARQNGLRSAFAFPIRFQDEFHGVMEFFCHDIRRPDQALLDMMASLGVLLGQFFQRKSAEQRLQELLALQQAILNNADRSIISTAPDGIIQVFNRAAERMIGYTAEEMVGKQTPEMFHDPEEVRARAEELSEEFGRTIEPNVEVFFAKPALGETEEREWTYRRKDGSRFPALLTVASCRDSTGRITGYSEIANDITEQKRVEEELRQAKQAAEGANKAKSEFLANMSHEIRTPMNGIVGMTNLALATPLRADQKEFLDVIKESADALLTVINDILDFSKVEAGMFELEDIRFNLREKLASAMQVLSTRAHEKGLNLVFDMDPAVPLWVSGDPGRLRQIIMNLVGNAVKFTTQGEIALHVSVDKSPGEDANNCLLHFAVSDTGIGISLEKQKMIFDPFSQADCSTTRRFGGTGLGLTICSRMVELMGGKIWVESEVGHGSTFHFTAYFNLAGKSAVTAADPQSPVRHAQNLDILVADDTAINRLVAVRILELAGHHATVVVNGQEALNALARGDFDLVLMDVQMPFMDGFEATARIREYEKVTGEHMPIVAMTAHAMKRDRDLCVEAGMDAYVSKPIEEVDLFSAIDCAIAGVTQSMDNATEVHRDTCTTTAITDLPDNDDVFQRELAQLFLEDCPHSLSEVHEAITTRNGPALKLVAHSLESSARILNDEMAAEAARRIETIAGNNDWGNAAKASLELTQEMTRLTAAMIELTSVGTGVDLSSPSIPLLNHATSVCSPPLPTAV